MKLRSGFIFVMLFAILIGGISGFVWTQPAFAQDEAAQSAQAEQPKCWALDVVMIVDVSGSMTINDPEQYRFEAVQEVIGELVQNRQEECPDAIHRIGLITFSNDATVYTKNLRRIDINADQDPASWIDAGFGQYLRDAEGATHGDTSFETGFAAAKALFIKADTDPIKTPDNYGPRKQVVIFITDGKPTYAAGATNPSATPSLMCQWDKELEDSFWNNKSIWILPLHASDSYLDEDGCSGKTVRRDLQQDDEKSNGQLAEFAYNNQTIPSFVSTLLAKEFGKVAEKVSCNDVFYVDPYLKSMKLRFFSDISNKSDQVTVTLSKLDNTTNQPIYVLQDGQVLQESKGVLGNMLFEPKKDYNSARKGKEEYLIRNPLPGKWKYEVQGMSSDECTRTVEGTKIQIVADVELLESGSILPQVAEAPYYDPAAPIPFTVHLSNSETSQLLVSDPQYPLEIKIEWALPSGNDKLPDGTRISPILLSPTATGEWINNGKPILTPETGKYTLTIVGTTKSGDLNKDIDVFRETRSFEVKALERFQFELMEPKANDTLSCNAVSNGKSISKPIPVTVQLLDNLHKNTTVDKYILSSPDETFVAELVDAKGQVVDSVSLTSGDAGIFQGVLLSQKTEVLGCGKGQIRVKFVGKYDTDRFALPLKEHSLSVERVQSKGVVANVVAPSGKDSLARFSKTLDACSIENIQPVSILFDLRDLDGKPLEPADVLATGKESLYQVRIKGPSSKDWENLPVSISHVNGAAIIFATGGADIPDEGEYQFEIIPIDGSFTQGFVAAQNTISGRFTRQDTFFTTPLACQATRGSLGLLGIALVGLLVFVFTGGPGGTLMLKDKDGDILWSKPLGIARLFTWFKYRMPTALKEKGIVAIKYKKGASSHPNAPVADLTIFTNEDAPYLIPVEAGSESPLSSDFYAGYSHPKAKNLSNGPEDF